ncbi:MAG: hypothetical protein LBS19_13495, partial [Clostridiales bacterium]|nr:hypothetical protein [Clostridiales bacterium]
FGSGLRNLYHFNRGGLLYHLHRYCYFRSPTHSVGFKQGITDRGRETLKEAEDALAEAKDRLKKEQARKDFSAEPDVAAAQAALDAADAAVRNAKRSLEDDGSGSAEHLLAAERAVEQAGLDLQKAKGQAQKSVDEAWDAFNDNKASTAEQLLAAQQAIESAQLALDKAVAAAGDDVKAATEAYEDNERDYASRLLDAERAADKAERDLEAAEIKSVTDATEAAKEKRRSAIDLINWKAERDELIKSIAALEEAVSLGESCAPRRTGRRKASRRKGYGKAGCP